MTSKNLFFNLMKEDLRRRLWAVILASIVFFFILPIATVMLLQHYLAPNRIALISSKTEWLETVSEIVGNYLGNSGNFLLIAAAVVGAIICGISGYAFLHSKKQVDFYHSLPVKRETIFFVHFIDGILIYLIPYSIAMLLSWLICLLFGVVSGEMLLMSLGGLLFYLIIFLSFYLFTILATLLTGKLIITLFGVAVLFLYVPVIRLLLFAYKNEFLETIYNNTSASEIGSQIANWLSPISQSIWLSGQYEGDGINFVVALLGFAVFAALMLTVCVFLYKKRKSEKAGTAMAFTVSEPIIRILIAIPVGLGFGIILLMIQYQSSGLGACLWLCFGAAIGAFLAHGIIESLYQFDVKKCLSHKLQLLGTIVVTAAIAMSFFYDWFHFDSYLPKKEEIRTMAINCYQLTDRQDYYDNGSYEGGMEYTMEHMALESFDAAYEIAKLCSAHVAKTKGNSGFSWPENSYLTNIVIKYELRNGRSVYREYSYNAYEIMDLLAELYRQEEYKKQTYQVLKLEELGAVVTGIECTKAMKEVNLTLDQAEREQLLALYQKEMMALEFSELVTTPPVGTISFMTEVRSGKNSGKVYRYQMYLYPSMRGTLDFLSRHGFDVDRIGTAEEVETIYFPYHKNGDLEITDPKEIAECMKYLVPASMARCVPFYNYANSCRVVFRLDDYGNQWDDRYYFNELPDFMKERLDWQ